MFALVDVLYAVAMCLHWWICICTGGCVVCCGHVFALMDVLYAIGHGVDLLRAVFDVTSCLTMVDGCMLQPSWHVRVFMCLCVCVSVCPSLSVCLSVYLYITPSRKMWRVSTSDQSNWRSIKK